MISFTNIVILILSICLFSYGFTKMKWFPLALGFLGFLVVIVSLEDKPPMTNPDTVTPIETPVTH